MATTNAAITNTEIFKAVREAEKRILPAKLVDPLKDGGNGYKIAGYVKEHNLDPRLPESYEQAFKALFTTLEWVVKPKALLLIEKQNAPAPKENPRLLEEARAKAVKALDAADAQSKADAKTWQRITDQINGFSPRRESAKIDERAKLHKYAATQKANNAIPQTVVDELSKYIDKCYKDEERAAAQVTNSANKMAY
jgi:hypothetical protein